jgi:hypothetical protein
MGKNVADENGFCAYSPYNQNIKIINQNIKIINQNIKITNEIINIS